MKHLFIINPAAGAYDHTKEFTQVIDRVCQRHGLEYEIAVSDAPGACMNIAKKAAETGEELRLYACGGDGTLNEVINGAAGFENVSVTHFPGGSGNDTIKVFSETKPFHHLERLLDCEEATFDLIRCNDRYSVNIVSMGLDARVSRDMTRYRRLPMVGGKGSYVMSLVSNLFKGLSQPMTIRIDGELVVDSKQTLVCVCNGRWYGGQYNPVPDAEVDDGMLDVLIIRKIALWQVPALLAKYQVGRYKELGEYITHYRCRSVDVECPKPSVVNIDGECHDDMRVHMEVVPGALRFFYPKGLTYAVKEFTHST